MPGTTHVVSSFYELLSLPRQTVSSIEQSALSLICKQMPKRYGIAAKPID